MSENNDVRKSRRTDPPGQGKPSRKPEKAKSGGDGTVVTPPWEQAPQPTGDEVEPNGEVRANRSPGRKRGERAGSPHCKRARVSRTDDYHVGYGKPPKETRFQKGNQAASGRGRPKGSRNRAIVVKEVAEYKVDVTMPNGSARKVTFWEAGIWKLAIQVAQGNLKALAQYTELHDCYGIALPEPPALADPLTQDEDTALQLLFADWAMDNPDRARELLEKILALPSSLSTTDTQPPQHAQSADLGATSPAKTTEGGGTP